jgi:hypothetical protein
VGLLGVSVFYYFNLNRDVTDPQKALIKVGINPGLLESTFSSLKRGSTSYYVNYSLQLTSAGRHALKELHEEDKRGAEVSFENDFNFKGKGKTQSKERTNQGTEG